MKQSINQSIAGSKTLYHSRVTALYRRRTSANSPYSIASLAGVNRSRSTLYYVATAGFRYRAITDLRRTSRVVYYLARLPSLAYIRRGPEVDLLR
jgi:hypothetical protein